MANGLSTLVQALLGGAAGGFKGYAEGQYAKQEKEEREAERKRQKEQQDRLYQMQVDAANATKTDRERGYAKEAWAMASPEDDLTTNPLLPDMKRFGFGLKETPAVSAPKLSDSLTLPSMPSSTPSTGIGGAASTPMTGGKYDPTAPEGDEAAPTPPTGPTPLPVGGPMTFATPTYGLGAPAKVTRAETRQESQQRIERENEIAMLTEQLPQVAPQYRTLLEASIKALKAGGRPEITGAMMRQVIADSQPKPPVASAQPDFEFVTAFEIANNKAFDPATATPAEKKAAVAEQARQKIAGTRPPASGGGSTSTVPTDIAAPLDPESQDLIGQAGLSYPAFMVLTGRMSQLGRDTATRQRATNEVQQWAASRGMDVSTLTSQYKAYNDVLEANIERYNRTVMAEGEIKADVENLIEAAKTSGLGDARAVNAAKQWLKGELNDPNAAQYAFFLNQLTNDIALYNAASQGRAPLNADLEEAKTVVQRGIASGSLTGMQKALTSSVEKMGQVLEGGVNRARQNVWNLFGVGDKYKPSKTAGGGGAVAPSAGGTVEMVAPDGRILQVPKDKVAEMAALGATLKGGE